MQRCIPLVYNYASNAREQYLLLQLYRKALKTEVEEKVDQIKDIITGNPLFIKLVVNQYRDEAGIVSCIQLDLIFLGGNYLQSVLADIVNDMLAQGSVDLETDPITLYKRMVAKIESESGEKANLPYDISREEALQHDKVVEDVNTGIDNLISFCSRLRDSIIDHLAELPFGLRYICKMLRQDLTEKFPEAPEDDITKAIGAVLYYRYFSPVLIAPERFLKLGGGDDMSAPVNALCSKTLITNARLLLVTVNAVISQL